MDTLSRWVYSRNLSLRSALCQYLCRSCSYRSYGIPWNTHPRRSDWWTPRTSVLVLWDSRCIPTGLYLYDAFWGLSQRVPYCQRASLNLKIVSGDIFLKNVFLLTFRKPPFIFLFNFSFYGRYCIRCSCKRYSSSCYYRTWYWYWTHWYGCYERYWSKSSSCKRGIYSYAYGSCLCRTSRSSCVSRPLPS